MAWALLTTLCYKLTQVTKKFPTVFRTLFRYICHNKIVFDDLKEGLH